MRQMGIVFLLIITLLVGGCGTNPPRTQPEPPKEPSRTTEEIVRERARQALLALQAADGGQLASLVHPTKGVRFSPYAFVRTGQDGDLVFRPDQLRAAAQDPTIYRWGYSDGSGKPIEMTLQQYLKGIYRKDYLNAPQVGYNQIIREGNTKINIREVYPEGQFMEFHVPGTGEHADFTWSSLRLVFEEEQGIWYLVGVIHDQWTI